MVHLKLLERCVGYLLYFDMTLFPTSFPNTIWYPFTFNKHVFVSSRILKSSDFGQIRKAEEEEWRPRLGNQYSGDPFVTVAVAVTDEAMRQLMTPCLGSIGPVTTVSI